MNTNCNYKRTNMFLREFQSTYPSKPGVIPSTFSICTCVKFTCFGHYQPHGLHVLIYVSLPSQIPTLPRTYRERERERERLRRESETEEDEERVLGEVSDGEESDDTAYDRRHTIPPCDLP